MANGTEFCPACRMPMARPGRLVAAVDDAGTHFVFGLCPACTGRLNRLRVAWQYRELDKAIRMIARHPLQHPGVKFFPGETEARLYCALESERLGAPQVAQSP
jgi:hypothetical protein